MLAFEISLTYTILRSSIDSSRHRNGEPSNICGGCVCVKSHGFDLEKLCHIFKVDTRRVLYNTYSVAFIDVRFSEPIIGFFRKQRRCRNACANVRYVGKFTKTRRSSTKLRCSGI